MHAAFPDLHMTIEEVITAGEKVIGRVSVSGTHNGPFLGIAPTGKRVSWTGIGILRICDGKMAERWNESDLLAVLEQLGVVTLGES